MIRTGSRDVATVHVDIAIPLNSIRATQPSPSQSLFETPRSAQAETAEAELPPKDDPLGSRCGAGRWPGASYYVTGRRTRGSHWVLRGKYGSCRRFLQNEDLDVEATSDFARNLESWLRRHVLTRAWIYDCKRCEW
ncbi:hypothetical protein LIA77_02143 [Sarocladium implicatum]|jgi:hypothetical protein|nr:hypothetical protein LIA77_02143 [Sarocladium implicatum]